MNKLNHRIIKLTSWNIEGRLNESSSGYRGSSKQIVQTIEKLDSDIVLLLESHQEKSIRDLPDQFNKLQNMGYKIYESNYSDDLHARKDTYAKRLSMLLLSKFDVTEYKTIRLGNLRNAIVANIKISDSNEIRIVGVHLDDRSEKTRLMQAADLIKTINESSMPTVLMGDFNAMHGDDILPARFLKNKLVKSISRYLLPNISLRAIEMASGTTLKLIESQTNLVDVDPRHQPTTTPKMRGLQWMPSVRLIQIDHIYKTPDIKISQFKIAPDGGSDHRAISADIYINPQNPSRG